MKPYLISLLLLASGLVHGGISLPVIHHDLRVKVEPQDSRLQATDRLQLPKAVRTFEFMLHDGLDPRLESPAGRLLPLSSVPAGVPARRYRVELEQPAKTLTLSWNGRIRHPVTGDGHSRRGAPGTLSAEGVYLAGSTLWYPWSRAHLVTFEMTIGLPRGWQAISQGRPVDGGWREDHPQDDIYLVAGRYQRYERTLGRTTAMVWLRHADDGLANRYLDATGRYIGLYDHLIGPYPYAKFALVENFWESGYGMPSFTLLGPGVIRLPFILHSSYPHEILHNWWGNSVYVDYASGNWAEGLTSYLADHLLKEQQGQGAAYRRDTLLNYANWVKSGRDLPLVRFRGRHGEASQAAGYGRMLMFMHMLRLQLGDRPFIEGLRDFYRHNRFRIASFDDLQASFETASGKNLDAEFRQWTRRTGAPALALEKVSAHKEDERWRLTGVLHQTQEEAPFHLRVPLYVQLEGTRQPMLRWLEMKRRKLPFELVFDRRPLQLRVDPLYDLFRRLGPDETPPSLGALFGADQLTLILPRKAPRARREAWKSLATAWQQRYPQARIRWDDELEQLPTDSAFWVLDAENRFAPQMLELLASRGVKMTADSVTLDGQNHALADNSLVLATRTSVPVGLALSTSNRAIAALARKLPHYGKYGYLLFEGDGAVNLVKGQWPAGARALSVVLVQDQTLPPLQPADHPPLARFGETAGQQDQANR
ncbi:MAG: M1 family peptidase [Gammaproteobacteria bacterium]|nr:MAG: M1 family peptidase [Gammaproteobacteria bacterium]RTZ72960.1 MAG: M1 family peptidase [Gammaproteobacteria bacterium]